MKRRGNKSRQRPDYYSRRASRENFPARSVYKLKEIQEKYGLIKKGGKVLDLGCAPGSWLKYAADQTGRGGKVFGIDLDEVAEPLPENVHVHKGDAEALSGSPGKVLEITGGQVDVVLSDMAPSTTGKKDVDAARSFNLSLAALSIARDALSPGGSFVCKIFQGEDFQGFTQEVKKTFKSCKIYKPRSTRSQSRETYVIGKGKKQEDN